MDLLDRLRTALADRYTVTRQLGRGRAARVFLAEEHRPRRLVALKVLDPAIAAAIGAERFLQEIEAAAELTHPRILPIHAAGEADGELYYTMPYIDGESLRARLDREGPLPVRDALQIATEVGDALDHAHRNGVVHHHLTPTNILLQGGHALVTDFGMAGVVGQAGRAVPEGGMGADTAPYLSPEQASGQPGADGRSDVYSLGCILYEMLTGAPPFTGPTPQGVVVRHLVDPVPPLASARADLPPPVVLAIERALAKAPADRWPTAGELARGLESQLTGSAAVDVPRQPWRDRWRRSRMLVAIAVIVAAATLGVLTLPFFQRPREPSATLPALPPGMTLVVGGAYRLFGGDCPLCIEPQLIDLDSFLIDSTETTVGQYAPFVAAGLARAPWTRQPPDQLPVTGVLWTEANRYCPWRDSLARLPTEEQWEAAARGFEGRLYPWGPRWDASRANADGAHGALAPVGSFAGGASPSGALDMAGNAWEWTGSPGPAGPRSELRYVLRGGAFDSPPDAVTTVFRTALPVRVPPDSISTYLGSAGFRCARPLQGRQ